MAFNSVFRTLAENAIKQQDEWTLCIIYEDLHANEDFIKFCVSKDVDILKVYERNTQEFEEEEECENDNSRNYFEISNKVNELFQARERIKSEKYLDLDVSSWYNTDEDGNPIDEGDLPNLGLYYSECHVYEDESMMNVEEEEEISPESQTREGEKILILDAARKIDIALESANDEVVHMDFQISGKRRRDPSPTSIEFINKVYLPSRRVEGNTSRSSGNNENSEKESNRDENEGDESSTYLRYIITTSTRRIRDKLQLLEKFSIARNDVVIEEAKYGKSHILIRNSNENLKRFMQYTSCDVRKIRKPPELCEGDSPIRDRERPQPNKPPDLDIPPNPTPKLATNVVQGIDLASGDGLDLGTELN